MVAGDESGRSNSSGNCIDSIRVGMMVIEVVVVDV